MLTNFEELITEFSDCSLNSKVAIENGKRFEIESNDVYSKLRIDGCLITSTEIEKCDFGFLRHSNGDFYFVELKGKDIEKAYNQIVNSILFFENNVIKIPQNKRFCFIVSSSGIPRCQLRISQLKQKFARDKRGCYLEITNRVIKYKPS